MASLSAPPKVTKSTSREAALADRRYYVVDAAGMVLGRLASQIALVLMGKNRATYTPNVDDGDFVIVVNAEKVRLTGGKEDKKLYYDHTGWMGGIKKQVARKLRERKPTELLKRAVSGMLPKGPLGHQMRDKLTLYAGPDHPHAAQKPEPLMVRL